MEDEGDDMLETQLMKFRVRIFLTSSEFKEIDDNNVRGTYKFLKASGSNRENC